MANTKLFSDKTYFMADARNPIFDKKSISYDHIKQYPIISVDYAEEAKHKYQDFRDLVNVVVPHARIILLSLLGTDYITHSAMRLAQSFVDDKKIKIMKNVKNMPEVFKSNKFEVYCYWHNMQQNNKENMWLRDIMGRAIKLVDEENN